MRALSCFLAATDLLATPAHCRHSNSIKITEAIRTTVNAMRACCGDDAMNGMLQVSKPLLQMLLPDSYLRVLIHCPSPLLAPLSAAMPHGCRGDHSPVHVGR